MIPFRRHCDAALLVRHPVDSNSHEKYHVLHVVHEDLLRLENVKHVVAASHWARHWPKPGSPAGLKRPRGAWQASHLWGLGSQTLRQPRLRARSHCICPRRALAPRQPPPLAPRGLWASCMRNATDCAQALERQRLRTRPPESAGLDRFPSGREPKAQRTRSATRWARPCGLPQRTGKRRSSGS